MLTLPARFTCQWQPDDVLGTRQEKLQFLYKVKYTQYMCKMNHFIEQLQEQK